MLDELGRMSLLVEDHDEAIEFYTDRLGFDVVYDGSLDDGTRLVHLGLPSDDGIAVWLFEARTDEQRDRVGNQTGGHPCGVFYTEDCRGACEELRRRDVTVRGEPVESESNVSVRFEDLYGNAFVLVELKE